MFKELKNKLDKFYELEQTFKNNQKAMDKLEGEIYSLEKKLSSLIEDYNIIKKINTDIVNERKKMEKIINEMIRNINK